MKKLIMCIVLMALSVNAKIIPVPYLNLPQNYKFVYKDTAIFQKLMYVDSGLTLAADSGVVMKFAAGAGLVIAKGGKLVLLGTATNPVILTAESDSLKAVPNIKSLADAGLWNGVTILGKATVKSTEPIYYALDKDFYWSGTPIKPKTTYGGTDDNDSSGVLRYVSIRYAGTNIYHKTSAETVASELWDDKLEFNGLALCGVGAKTVVEYVEVYCGLDDGFKFLGGSVNCRYLVSTLAHNSAFDMDEGYRGSLQYLWGTIINPVKLELNINFEEDDATLFRFDQVADVKDATAVPKIANVTAMAKDGDHASIISSTPVKWINSIFMNVKAATFNNTGGCFVANNIFGSNVYPTVKWTDFASSPALITHLINNNNDAWVLANSDRKGFFRGDGFEKPSKSLDPRPRDSLSIDSAYIVSVDTLKDAFFRKTSFKGAFNPFKKSLWVTGWTAMSMHGFLDDTLDRFPGFQVLADTENDSVRAKRDVTFSPLARILDAKAFSVQVQGPRLVISLPGASPVNVEVFNTRGQRIRSIVIGKASAGKFDLRTSDMNLAKGLYVFRVNALKHSASVLMSVVR